MKIDDEYFEKYVLTCISPNGEIINIDDQKEKSHYLPYMRLNKKLYNQLGEISEHDSGQKLANVVAKKGYIHLWPFNIEYDSEYRNSILIIFPYKPKIPQLQTLRLFHAPLAYVNSLFFFKKPNKGECLDYSSKDIIKGLNDLMLYEIECYKNAKKEIQANVEK